MSIITSGFLKLLEVEDAKSDSTANLHPIEITDGADAGKKPTIDDLASTARDSVGSNKLGNKSPSFRSRLPVS